MNGLVASVLASIPAWGLEALLDGRVSEGTRMVLSFALWAVVFVPAFVWVKRLREGS